MHNAARGPRVADADGRSCRSRNVSNPGSSLFMDLSPARDLRYFLRTLRKSPAFLAIAALSLALGTGANTAIITLVHQLILAPLPVTHPEQIAMLAGRGNITAATTGWTEFRIPCTTKCGIKRNLQRDVLHLTFPSFGGVSAAFGGHTELLGRSLFRAIFSRFRTAGRRSARCSILGRSVSRSSSAGGFWRRPPDRGQTDSDQRPRADDHRRECGRV
jgi:hypothetical protein